MRFPIKNKCRINPSLDCIHPDCALENDAFMDAAIRWIITIPLKIHVNNNETNELMRRCDVAICFKGRDLAVKYFETYGMNKRTCEQLQDAGNEFKLRCRARLAA